MSLLSLLRLWLPALSIWGALQEDLRASGRLPAMQPATRAFLGPWCIARGTHPTSCDMGHRPESRLFVIERTAPCCNILLYDCHVNLDT